VIRIAFVKYAGLAAGGTERWLQSIAAHLPPDEFAVDYFWCEAVPYVGSRTVVAGTDPDRRRALEDSGLNLVEFHLDAVDVRRDGGLWLGTDFWERFDPAGYDLVQTAKQGLPEYPFTQMDLPVFEQVAYNGGVDHSPNVVRSSHWSQWQRAWWHQRGGDLVKSFVAPIPVLPPRTTADMRDELGIPPGAVVVGFHQRVDDRIFSPVQVEAFAAAAGPGDHLVVLGGSPLYGEQARRLGVRHVHQLPHTGDDAAISRFLNTLDVFAHGRRDGETFGSVLSEAMAHGLPCVSHRVPAGGNAQRETIGPAGSVAASVGEYARILGELMADADLRRRLGDRGCEHAARRYSLEAAIACMAGEYRAFLEGSAEPPARRSPWTPYGECPDGFLVAGDLDDEAQPLAHSVLTGRAPRPAEVALTRHLVGRCERVVELGAAGPTVALVVAGEREDVPVEVREEVPGACAVLRETLRLNGWEERVVLCHLPGCAAAEAGAAAGGEKGNGADAGGAAVATEPVPPGGSAGGLTIVSITASALAAGAAGDVRTRLVEWAPDSTVALVEKPGAGPGGAAATVARSTLMDELRGRGWELWALDGPVPRPRSRPTGAFAALPPGLAGDARLRAWAARWAVEAAAAALARAAAGARRRLVGLVPRRGVVIVRELRARARA
jgi:glycosyltransferase involved in cell wall biosynthesis